MFFVMYLIVFMDNFKLIIVKIFWSEELYFYKRNVVLNE